MKILIDEGLPRYLTTAEILSVYGSRDGLGGDHKWRPPGESQWRVRCFADADKNLRHQQNLSGLTLSIVVFPSNRLSAARSLVARLLTILPSLKPGEVVELD